MLQLENGETRRVGVVPADAPRPEKIKQLDLILIRPSKYDDDGYVMRYWRGVLPSNTLATLAGLTREVAESRALGDVKINVVMLDETVQRIDVARLRRRHVRRGVRAVAALAGVQTNQFPRAADLARMLHDAGFSVMIGGFHVSGVMAMSKAGTPPEFQALMDGGITLVRGEVEECWADLLRDALHGRLRSYYEILQPPELDKASLPLVDPELMKHFAYAFMGTIDAGRGCPFHCSFCTIINVQGHKMRCRSAEAVRECIRRNARHKIDYYFFTDDNFSRNPHWEEIFDELIALRAEGHQFNFMMQVDVLAHRIRNFVSKAASAGCSQVFVGMESINPDNLEAIGKKQNLAVDYRQMVAAWHVADISVHVGYIIGFPFDTPASVAGDMRKLREEIQVDQASFFMLTPLPGSADYAELAARGAKLDPDFNRFDSFHAAMPHARMSADEWFETYQAAWRGFYSTENMKVVLSRANARTYWSIFKNFLWYRYSALIEKTHPMICGFVRFKGRLDRRPGLPIETRGQYWRRRVDDWRVWSREVVHMYLQMQEVWLATRQRAQRESNWASWRRNWDEMRGWLGNSRARASRALAGRVSLLRAGAEESWLRASRVRRQGADDIARRWGELRAEAEAAWQRAGEAGRQRKDDLGRRLAGIRTGVEDLWIRAGESGRREAEALATRFRRLSRRPRSWARALRAPLARINPLDIKTPTRADLNEYWRQTFDKLRHGKIFRINPVRFGMNLARDLKLFVLFNIQILISHGK
ncbi:radical SAM protein [bacterium]|nr:radical SAM protein [bacterium]